MWQVSTGLAGGLAVHLVCSIPFRGFILGTEGCFDEVPIADGWWK